MSRDGYFITSFPYRDGYEITVDGQAVSPELVNTAFLGFPLKSGHHEIKIAFEAPGFALGRAVSLISAALMLAVMIMEKKGRKRDENFAAIAAVPLFDDGRNDDID